MRHITFTSLMIIGLMFLTYIGTASAESWEKDFVQALQKGKAVPSGQAGGLGYTPAEDTVLEEAIRKAMEAKAPPCSAMKIAVDMKYNPYMVIKNIYSYGGEVGLDQLCMCATESGVNKQIIAKAATDAATSLGEPVFSRDEIVQSQCLREIGLGYTETIVMPPTILAEPPPKYISAEGPTS